MIKNYKNYIPEIHDSCYVAESSQVIGKVKMGKNSSVWECAVIRGDVDKITIGESTNVQDGSILHVNNGIPLIIGNNVTIGHGVNLHGCSIGDNSLIGIGAIILNGAKIGDNCIVGAGAIVTQNSIIPNNSLVLGAPGKIIREISDFEVEENVKNAKNYVQLSKDYKIL